MCDILSLDGDFIPVNNGTTVNYLTTAPSEKKKFQDHFGLDSVKESEQSCDLVICSSYTLDDLVTFLENGYSAKKVFINFVDESLIKKVLALLEISGCEYYYLFNINSGRLFSKRVKKHEYDVSVVVPIYNIENYLHQCVDSLVAEKNIRLEILLVNDGSTDSSPQIVDEYASKYSNIKAIHKVNGGCASARTEGVKQATGQYIGFVDSDDWIAEDMYSDLYHQALFNGTDIVFSKFTKYYQEDELNIEHPEYINCSEGICNGVVLDKDTLFYLQPAIWRCIYRRDLIIDNNIDFPSEIRRFDDLYFNFLAITVARSASFVPKAYYYYRLGRQGQDVSIHDDRINVHMLIFKRLKEYLKKHGTIHDELNLKLVQINTHKWGLNQVEQGLKGTYLSHAIFDFNDNVFIDKLRTPFHLYRKFGPKPALSALAWLALSFFKSKEINIDEIR
ncbi:glycosyltransferase [Vibrio mediterranei]|uniref:glycosyltransferase n=1 Tax=Vibrio mediterranei TaxID=689 RepID=UPI004068D67E